MTNARPFGCTNSENLNYENIEKHLELCEKNPKIVSCNLCKTEFKVTNNDYKEFVIHNEDTCEFVLLECPICKKDFQRNSLNEHMENCPEREVICGKCNWKIPKKLEKLHEECFCVQALKVQKCLLKVQQLAIK